MSPKTSQLGIQEIINRSGHELHFDVVNTLRARGWSALVSPYYSDAQTGRSREIDIIATKEDGVVGTIAGSGRGLLEAQLYIECKYIVSPTVFWFDVVDTEERLKLLSAKTPFDERELRLSGAQHHYLNPANNKVAKLFSSSDKETQNEQFFGAVNQVLHGAIYSNPRQVDRGDYQHSFETDYQVIVCKNFSNLLVRDNGTSEGFRPAESPFLFEANYAYQDRSGAAKNQYFLVDIVDADHVEEFLSEIEGDLQAMKGKMCFEMRTKSRI